MNIDEIILKRNQLNHDLRIALATMERKDTVAQIRKAIIENQDKCPHISSKYNWAIVDGTCPYCGRHIGGGEES